ncbi:MAG: ATP-binding cassette domain-containing protein [Prosthecochloris sp.]|nr:ABC transporter ATP-binding protein [Prosthecochloris sp. HL-130-GSB]MBO8092671.1 ATP-binding cassette domain-containing protein [Prosthecochloris sp.]
MLSLLDIENLSFSYGPAQVTLFEDLQLTVDTGAFVLLRGASGTGKSTLLRLICRLQPFSHGRILFKGRSIDDMPPAELRQRVLYTAQIPAMIDDTVKANLLFPFDFEVNRGKATPADDHLRQMLERFFLKDISLDQHALKLSVGQQQRVALMRAILQQPEMLLLDEPTSALDAESASMVFSIIEHLNRDRRMTIIAVTHSDYQPERVEAFTYLLENRKLRLL